MIDTNRARHVIDEYRRIFIEHHLIQGVPYDADIHIRTDGANSPVAGRLVLTSGRIGLHETVGDGERVIVVFKSGQNPSYRNHPTQRLVDALEYRTLEHQIAQINNEEFTDELAKIIHEYRADKSPVITVDAASTDQTLDTSPQADDSYTLMGKGVAEPLLKNLRKYRGGVTHIQRSENTDEFDGPYQSNKQLKSAHADETGVYIIEDELNE